MREKGLALVVFLLIRTRPAFRPWRMFIMKICYTRVFLYFSWIADSRFPDFQTPPAQEELSDTNKSSLPKQAPRDQIRRKEPSALAPSWCLSSALLICLGLDAVLDVHVICCCFFVGWYLGFDVFERRNALFYSAFVESSSARLRN